MQGRIILKPLMAILLYKGNKGRPPCILRTHCRSQLQCRRDWSTPQSILIVTFSCGIHLIPVQADSLIKSNRCCPEQVPAIDYSTLGPTKIAENASCSNDASLKGLKIKTNKITFSKIKSKIDSTSLVVANKESLLRPTNSPTFAHPRPLSISYVGEATAERSICKIPCSCKKMLMFRKAPPKYGHWSLLSESKLPVKQNRLQEQRYATRRQSVAWHLQSRKLLCSRVPAVERAG